MNVAATIAILAIRMCISEVTTFTCGVSCGSKPIIKVYTEDEYCYGCRTSSRTTLDCDREHVYALNGFHDRPSLDVMCSDDYYISGIWNSRENLYEVQSERGYKCCRVKGLCTKNCKDDGPISIHGDVSYNLKAG